MQQKVSSFMIFLSENAKLIDDNLYVLNLARIFKITKSK